MPGVWVELIIRRLKIITHNRVKEDVCARERSKYDKLIFTTSNLPFRTVEKGHVATETGSNKRLTAIRRPATANEGKTMAWNCGRKAGEMQTGEG